MENDKFLPDEQSDELKNYAKKIIQRFEIRRALRSNFETHWQECFDYIVPRKAEITTQKTPGDKRGNQLFDTTAIMSNQLLAGALHGMLTNPTVRFFDLTMGDPALDAEEDVKFWLQDTAERMFNVLNNTNFQTEVHEVYLDQGAIGTACLFMGEHPEKVVHYSARSMAEIYVGENNLGIIDEISRCYKWTARQIVQEFGEDKVPEFIGKAYEQGKEDKFEVIHDVSPVDNDDRYSGVFAFKSCYVLKEKAYVLSEGGFHENPYATPRWTKVTGEVYGRGPGMEMLPDIKMVNVMMEVTLKGAQKTIDPPLMVSDDGVIGNVRLQPGGLTVVRPSTEVPIRPLITDARIDFGYQAVEDVRKRIRSGFYVDQLQLNEGPQMTATEVMQRTEEKLRLMGPVLGRQHYEFLRPVIERLFGIMYRRKMVLPSPAKIQGKKFDVRYSSLIARSQRMSEGQNLVRAVSALAPIIELDPKVMDNLNTDETFKHGLDIYGLPAKLLRKKGDVDKMRSDRAAVQQAAQQQQQQDMQAEQVSKMLPGAAQVMMANKK